MRLTRFTDYALRVLLYLAERPGRHCPISEIAAAHGISANHLAKVVHGLGKAGYVAARRGRSGGLRLARPAGEIRVGAVVARMEADFDLVDCPGCRIAAGCGLRGALGEALAAFVAVLDRYSLDDLVGRAPGPLALFGLPGPQGGGRALTPARALLDPQPA